jgi:methylmalonyl-CoA mutase
MNPKLSEAFFDSLLRAWGADDFEKGQALHWRQVSEKECKGSGSFYNICFNQKKVPAYESSLVALEGIGNSVVSNFTDKIPESGNLGLSKNLEAEQLMGWRIGSAIHGNSASLGSLILEALESGADALSLGGDLPNLSDFMAASQQVGWNFLMTDIRKWDYAEALSLWDHWGNTVGIKSSQISLQGEVWGTSMLMKHPDLEDYNQTLRKSVETACRLASRFPLASPVLLSAEPLLGAGLHPWEAAAVMLRMAQDWLGHWDSQYPLPPLCLEYVLGSNFMEEIAMQSVLCRGMKALVSDDVIVRYWSRPRSMSSFRSLTHEEDGAREILQLTMAVLCAALGGADTIFLPDLQGSLEGVSDDDRRRLPRNVQLLIRDEAMLAKSKSLLRGSGTMKALEEAAWLSIAEVLTQIQDSNGLVDWLNLRLRKGTPTVVAESSLSDFQPWITHVHASIRSEPTGLVPGWESGVPPYLRGPYASMYVQRPWTIRQYAGFSTAADSNAFYKRNLAAGQKGLSVAFDLPTHRGYDSDHPRAVADVGKAGVAIDSIQDMKSLFKDLPLDQLSVSMTMNGAVVPVLAFFIAAAHESGVSPDKLTGTIQNDILKEFMVRNTYIYPPVYSMQIIAEIFRYCSSKMPRFNSISISGYHMHEAGAPAELELAYTLADGMEYLRYGMQAGLDIDEFAPRLSFFWATGMDFVTEIAKLRAGRLLWSRITREFGAKDPKSMVLRTHCQTSGWSLTRQDPYNNITRTCLEALSAVLGGTQSLHTNALDEAIALPTDYSAKIARDTQIFLQTDSGLCQWVDPLGGSHLLEQRTQELVRGALLRIQEIEDAGGMTRAMDSALPKRRIEEAAAVKQARIDTAAEIIVGVNAYTLPNTTKPVDIPLLRVNHQAVLDNQVSSLSTLRETRDQDKVLQALQALVECSRRIKEVADKHNAKEGLPHKGFGLMELAIEAAFQRATLGEISNALESAFGRYTAQPFTLQGVYARQIMNDPQFESARLAVQGFESSHGRRPRILVAKLGQDGHDRGAKIIATGFADLGFDVDLGPLFQTPEECARQAVENDVHWIGVSSLAAGHLTLIPALMQALHILNAQSIRVILGGVVPPEDYEALRQAGVQCIFGPGTRLSDAALQILNG